MDQPTYQPYGQTGGPAQGQQFPPPPPNSGARQNHPPASDALPNPTSQQQIPASLPFQPTSELEAGAVHADPHPYPLAPPLPQSQIDPYSASHEKPPPQPPRPDQSAGLLGATPQYDQAAYAPQSQQSGFPP